jgi:PhnB protein
MTLLNPYLSFRGTAKDAMEFYQSVFGGELTMSTFGEAGMPVEESEKSQLMHAQLISPTGLALMGSDTPSHMEYNPGNNVSVSLSGDDEAELRGYWDKLSVDATVTAPFEQAPWGDIFGMLTDRFGTHWLVNVVQSQQG